MKVRYLWEYPSILLEIRYLWKYSSNPSSIFFKTLFFESFLECSVHLHFVSGTVSIELLSEFFFLFFFFFSKHLFKLLASSSAFISPLPLSQPPPSQNLVWIKMFWSSIHQIICWKILLDFIFFFESASLLVSSYLVSCFWTLFFFFFFFFFFCKLLLLALLLLLFLFCCSCDAPQCEPYTTAVMFWYLVVNIFMQIHGWNYYIKVLSHPSNDM